MATPETASEQTQLTFDIFKQDSNIQTLVFSEGEFLNNLYETAKQTLQHSRRGQSSRGAASYCYKPTTFGEITFEPTERGSTASLNEYRLIIGRVASRNLSTVLLRATYQDESSHDRYGVYFRHGPDGLVEAEAVEFDAFEFENIKFTSTHLDPAPVFNRWFPRRSRQELAEYRKRAAIGPLAYYSSIGYKVAREGNRKDRYEVISDLAKRYYTEVERQRQERERKITVEIPGATV